MDYSGFLRSYIGSAIREANRFSSYNGRIAMRAGGPMPDMGNMHAADANLDALPLFVPNINAPIGDYEAFSSMVCESKPDLRILFPDSEGLRAIFSELSSRMGGDGGDLADVVSFAAKLNAEILEKKGILSNGDQIR